MSSIGYQPPRDWISQRMAVGVGLLIAYFVHYVFLWTTHTNKTEPGCIEYLKKRIHTFGIACLLSMNYLQSSTFQSILCWFTLLVLLALHIQFSCQFIKNNLNGFWIAYYLLQCIWYFGIIVDYYPI